MEDTTEKIRLQLSEICKEIRRCAEIEGFPPTAAELDVAERLLTDNTFDVVVCGEVKKGKSSLINAIIGEDILPVDTKVATSQAFKIYNDDQRSYSIVYTDGTREPVTKEQLDSYGSQLYIEDFGEQVKTNRVIDHIEVRTPISFLPKEAVIVDTPGIGALYADHEVITFRHLRTAMAAIFVMDPQNPLTEPEIKFLGRVAEITPNILLVMTKADNYDDDYLQTQCERNVEILSKQNYTSKLSNATYQTIHIYPVSSVLLSAVKENEPEIGMTLYNASSFDEVRKEFCRLIDCTLIMRKNVEVFNILKRYNDEVAKSIAQTDQIAKSPAFAEQLVKEKKEAQETFQSTWGEKGVERSNLLQRIASIHQSFMMQAQALFNPGSSLYQSFINEIDSINGLDEIKSYAAGFSNHFATEYARHWTMLNQRTLDSLNNVLAQYGKMIETQQSNDPEIFENLPIKYCQVPNFSIIDHFNNCRNGFFSGIFITSIGGTLGIAASMGPLLPIAAVLVGGFTIFSTIVGGTTDRYRTELKKLLNQNLNTLREAIMINPVNDLGKSQLESVKDRFQEYCMDIIKDIYENKLDSYRSQIESITHKMNIAKKEQTALVQRNIVVKNEWKKAYAKLIEVHGIITSLNSEQKKTNNE